MKSVGKEMDIVHGLTSLAADCIFFVALSIETLPVKGTGIESHILGLLCGRCAATQRFYYGDKIGLMCFSLLHAEAFITAVGKGSRIIGQHCVFSLPFLTSRLRVRPHDPP
jgi:hypothetical protein